MMPDLPKLTLRPTAVLYHANNSLTEASSTWTRFTFEMSGWPSSLNTADFSFELPIVHLDSVTEKACWLLDTVHSCPSHTTVGACTDYYQSLRSAKVKGHTHMCNPHPPSPEPERGWSIPPAHQGGPDLKPQPAENIVCIIIVVFCSFIHILS